MTKDDTRRANLLAVLQEMESSGQSGLRSQARALGIAHREITRLLQGAVMSDRMASEIEWAAQKPVGWMDSDHADDPLV